MSKTTNVSKSLHKTIYLEPYSKNRSNLEDQRIDRLRANLLNVIYNQQVKTKQNNSDYNVINNYNNKIREFYSFGATKEWIDQFLINSNAFNIQKGEFAPQYQSENFSIDASSISYDKTSQMTLEERILSYKPNLINKLWDVLTKKREKQFVGDFLKIIDTLKWNQTHNIYHNTLAPQYIIIDDKRAEFIEYTAPFLFQNLLASYSIGEAQSGAMSENDEPDLYWNFHHIQKFLNYHQIKRDGSIALDDVKTTNYYKKFLDVVGNHIVDVEYDKDGQNSKHYNEESILVYFNIKVDNLIEKLKNVGFTGFDKLDDHVIQLSPWENGKVVYQVLKRKCNPFPSYDAYNLGTMMLYYWNGDVFHQNKDFGVNQYTFQFKKFWNVAKEMVDKKRAPQITFDEQIWANVPKKYHGLIKELVNSKLHMIPTNLDEIKQKLLNAMGM